MLKDIGTGVVDKDGSRQLKVKRDNQQELNSELQKAEETYKHCSSKEPEVLQVHINETKNGIEKTTKCMHNLEKELKKI